MPSVQAAFDSTLSCPTIPILAQEAPGTHSFRPMDSYLQIAATVLRELRRPMDARQILKVAYQLSIVPRNLYGKTQHKTLQARIAEDIRKQRNRSAFIRTEPGRFFLRSLLEDASIPLRFRREFPARPRLDQLRSFNVTCFRRSDALLCDPGTFLDRDVLNSIPTFARRLADVSSGGNYFYLRTFVITERDRHVVVTRAAFRQPDAVGNKVSVGCLGYVKAADRTMFSLDALGVVDASVRTMAEHLHFSLSDIKLVREAQLLKLIGVMVAPKGVYENCLAAITVCCCPTNFDPIARYQGGGALYWQPIPARFNDIDALNPWSREIVEQGFLERSLCS